MASSEPCDDPAGIFVPWAGKNLRLTGGLYYVGIATDGEYNHDVEQSFSCCSKWSEELAQEGGNGRSHTPFWRYLNGLTNHLYGKDAALSSDNWGWSNLLKIGRTKGSPKDWPKTLINKQKDVAVFCLKHEFSILEKSIIFIGCSDDYGILDIVLDNPEWNMEFKEIGLYYTINKSNIYIWGYHPKYVSFIKLFDKQFEMIKRLVFENLDWTTH